MRNMHSSSCTCGYTACLKDSLSNADVQCTLYYATGMYFGE